MFNEKSKALAAVILAQYGATHFRVSADGELSVVNEHGIVQVVDAPELALVPLADSAYEAAAEAIAAAKESAGEV